MMNGIPIHRQTSLREKLKSSMCCFTGSVHQDPLEQAAEGFYSKLRIPRTPISPSGSSTGSTTSSWFKKSPMSEFGGGEPPRVRGRSLKSRMGRRNSNYRQSQSADFSYDPSSYALNFENESPQEDFPFRNFSSRLPASPPHTSPINYTDELATEFVGYR